MRTRSISRTLSIALAAAGLVSGCDNTPTRPGSLPAQDPRGRVVDVLRVEVVGPEVVPIGQAEQFRLIVLLTDGSSHDVTGLARWRPDNLLSLSMPGRVTGVEPGEARVIALWDGNLPNGQQFNPRGSVSKDVTVLPAGTFKLQGTVSEAGSSGPVHSALVEVTAGVGARLTAHTDQSGTYQLYGVAGEIGLRVTKDGYRPAERSTVVADSRATYHIELPLVVPRPHVSGIYTLTIKAAQSCGVGLGERHLPEDARVREYPADVRQDGPRVEVRLSGAALRRPLFSGRVEPKGIVFDLGDIYGHDTFVIEQLPNTSLFGVAGSVTAAISANHLGGALVGQLYIFERENRWPPIASCYSQHHQFLLTR